MSFWTRFDELLESNELVIDRPRGTTHPRYPDVVYPLDYGYLTGVSGGDGDGLDVWRGSLTPSRLVGVVCTVDTLKNDAEVKLLVGCTAAEVEVVDGFHNGNDFMSGIVVMRKETPKAPSS